MRTSTKDKVDSVEAYAELVAKLGDPAADRAALLAARGLDEAVWLEADARWQALLRRKDPEIADRFCAAYREALAETVGGAPTDRAPPMFPDNDDATAREAETRQMPARANANASATPAPEGSPRLAPSETPTHPSMHSGMRLLRFDPQTGRPLPRPLWVPLR